MIRPITFIAVFLPIAAASSWLECTNYDIPSFDPLLGSYQRGLCAGYPRNFSTQYAAGFGTDTAYAWAHDNCDRDKFNAGDYTGPMPMATYVAGQDVFLVHPARRHVADQCTNASVPSTSLSLTMSRDAHVDTFDVKLPLMGKDHVNGVIDHLGYQRCMGFCGDPERATCITGWVLPDDVAPGIHSFKWTWEFHAGEFYSTCFDALVISTTATPTATSPVPTATPTATSPVPTATPNATSPVPITISPSETIVPTTAAPEVITSNARPVVVGATWLVSYLLIIVIWH